MTYYHFDYILSTNSEKINILSSDKMIIVITWGHINI